MIAAGVAINNALNTLYMDQVTRDFNHSLSTFQSRVSHSKSDLESALNFTSKDELMVSLAYFISEYQSEERLKNSLDGEKKKAALILRPQLQSSSISSFAFYSKNGDLIAYAIRSPQAIRTGIVSKAQETSSIQEWETENFSRAWRLSNTKPDIPLSLHLLEQFESRPDTNDIEVELSENGSIKLQRARKITRGTLSGKPESVGFLLASAHFDSVFFENLSHIGRVNFSLENPG
ncbi:MAG: hypothetical protein OEX00_05300, partial [Gammaproteobacteria bacterium]|nr:hypothetical protein [Gammaproteobacteria bacterium]